MAEITYRKVGDYYLPNLTFPDPPKIGRYGRLRMEYLRDHKKITYSEMWLAGTLNPHLEEVDQQATEMLESLIKQMAKNQGVTEELKRTDQMKWVGMMNNIKAAAEEIVLNELIYS